MITQEQINSFTEDEFCVLLYVLNHIPETRPEPYELYQIKSLRLDYIGSKLNLAGNVIKEENRPILQQIWDKLNHTPKSLDEIFKNPS